MLRLARLAGSVAALVVASVACTHVAHAAGFATDDRGQLFQVLPRKLEAKLIGTVKVKQGEKSYTPILTDLALSSKYGMYGISYRELYKIDTNDPTKSKRVGDLGISMMNALAFDKEHNLWATGSSGLYRVSLLTGRAAYVGSFGGLGSSDGDLAFVDGKLYGTINGTGGTHLATIDTKTGRATSIGRIRMAGATLHSVWGLIWDGQRMFALTADGLVVQLDLKRAIATRVFRARARFWGACAMLRF